MALFGNKWAWGMRQREVSRMTKTFTETGNPGRESGIRVVCCCYCFRVRGGRG